MLSRRTGKVKQPGMLMTRRHKCQSWSSGRMIPGASVGRLRAAILTPASVLSSVSLRTLTPVLIFSMMTWMSTWPLCTSRQFSLGGRRPTSRRGARRSASRPTPTDTSSRGRTPSPRLTPRWTSWAMIHSSLRSVMTTSRWSAGGGTSP